MKKIILFILAIMALLPIATAQETWKPQTPSKTIRFRGGNCIFERRGYIYTICVRTDFTLIDEIVVVYLGNGRDNALKSINQLIDISNYLTSDKLPFDNNIFIPMGNYIEVVEKGEHNYGKAYINNSELKKMQKVIQKGI